MIERESAILAPIPEAESLVGELREQYDPRSAQGVPTHITILFPFKHPDEIKEEDIMNLRTAIVPYQQFDFEFSHVNTYPGVVFLEPTNRDRFISITKKLVEVFPGNLPYGGQFPNINPHLTIGHKLGDRFEECSQKAELIGPKLPLRARARNILLMTSQNGKWTVRERFFLS